MREKGISRGIDGLTGGREGEGRNQGGGARKFERERMKGAREEDGRKQKIKGRRGNSNERKGARRGGGAEQ